VMKQWGDGVGGKAAPLGGLGTARPTFARADDGGDAPSSCARAALALFTLKE
jgi:hypothetical protein